MKKITIATILVSLFFIGQAFAIQLSPTDDAFVYSAGPAYTTALGNLPNYVGYLQVSSNAQSGYVNTFLKFDLSGYTGIDSGILWLYDYSSAGTSSTNAYRVPNNWGEATVTGQNQPMYNPFDIIKPVTTSVSGVGWKSWDVSGFAADAAGDLLSLRLQTFTSGVQKFYSSENPNIDYRPYLEVTLTPAPVPEPGTVLLLGCGLIGLVWYSRTRRKA